MFNFFKKTIKVTFIDEVTGGTIGLSEMNLDQLPETFDKPTTMQLKEEEWKVTKADPVSANTFSQTKKLTLHLRKLEKIDPQTVRFSIPTISNELPDLNNVALFNDFTLSLHEDDWRQIEFFPMALLPTIQQEMALVEEVLDSEDSPESSGFKTVHLRTIQRRHLSIVFNEFCKLVSVQEKGALKVAFSGQSGYVKNGFALRSDNFTYYGTMRDGLIDELCLYQFEMADDEFVNVVGHYELVLTVWCAGQITTI
jgi:hypothetical protein